MKKKRYKSLSDIIGSDEFKNFRDGEATTGNKILDKIAKKKGKRIIDLSQNIVEVATRFYNSPENLIDDI